MSWEDAVNRYGALVEDGLTRLLDELTLAGRDYHPVIGEFYSNVKEYVLRRGRRIASSALLLTYEGYAGAIDERIMRVAVGMELYRHSILVHDDLVDEDPLRRGGPSLHALYARLHDERFGRGTAVFGGNALYSLAVNIIKASGLDAEDVCSALGLLAEGNRAVNESQILDLLFEYKEPGVDEWRVMASKRAASLFQTSLLIAATLAHVSSRDLDLLRRAGESIGFAFDIQDDIIDTYASEEQYGRPPGSDLARRKKPLHVIFALRQADRKRRRTLQGIMAKGKIGEEALEEARRVIRDAGGLEAAKRESLRYAEEAKRLIRETGMNSPAKQVFESLIGYVQGSLEWYA